MTPNVYAIGETTYDIIFKNETPVEAKVGGSMLNTAVSLGRLGINVGLISQMGNDKVGDIALAFLQNNGVSTTCVTRFDDHSRVALAFLDNDNNAQYSFLIPGIQERQIRFPQIKTNDIVLFGSSYAIKADLWPRLVDFIRNARQQGAFILYDPNFRSAHLKELDEAKFRLQENMALAHVVKGSDEDFANIWGVHTPEQAYECLQSISKASLIYTANKAGVTLQSSAYQKWFEVPKIQPVSTIGAGDTFSAGLIYSFIKHGITHQEYMPTSNQLWSEIISTSTVFAQHVCMSMENYLSTQMAAAYRL